MKHSQRRYVVPKTIELEMQVDVVMRGCSYTSYAEMFRCLVRNAFRHLQRQAYHRSLREQERPDQKS